MSFSNITSCTYCYKMQTICSFALVLTKKYVYQLKYPGCVIMKLFQDCNEIHHLNFSKAPVYLTSTPISLRWDTSGYILYSKSI